MTRIEQLIIDKYPNQLDDILVQIELLKLQYDEELFLEEDIIESILIELNII
ncbi:MAG: hypothetical protein ACOVK2_03945 [Candidatus Fonsibacter sp.]